jgi:hypothetical protein
MTHSTNDSKKAFLAATAILLIANILLMLRRWTEGTAETILIVVVITLFAATLILYRVSVRLRSKS